MHFMSPAMLAGLLALVSHPAMANPGQDSTSRVGLTGADNSAEPSPY